ncbi:HalOD1 output domain-containing protein [Haladaptatus sp. CMAA 1911]|uniref:HalOD1 output domain-containing protein n=1 Tax=unclassified Haladaptatus TaxID=2622732 RepID=UPI003753EA2F
MHNSPPGQKGTPTRITPEEASSVVSAVVAAVTKDNGTKPETTLYEAIDPDALEDLYEHGRQKVTFEYADHKVTIHPDKTVVASKLST